MRRDINKKPTLSLGQKMQVKDVVKQSSETHLKAKKTIH